MDIGTMTKLEFDIPDDMIKIFQKVGNEQGKTTEEFILEIIEDMALQLKKGMVIPRLETRIDWSKDLTECKVSMKKSFDECLEMMDDIQDELT